MTISNSILLIEDDLEMLEILGGTISKLGMNLEHAADGLSGLKKALDNQYALVIVDCNLPQLSGFEVCKRLRKEREKLPILMLTSLTDEIDKIIGLELGADDYVTKPFNLRELAARIKGLLRRGELCQRTTGDGTNSVDKSNLNFGRLQIDHVKRLVVLDGERIDLTATEYTLLYLMASNVGKVFTREELMSEVWGITASNFEPTVTVTLSRLRCKLESNPNSPIYLQTIRGIGYRFTDEYENSSE